VEVLVATPGRLIDHIDSGKVRLDKTEVIVLDEADHMLDLGFVLPIKKIVARLPKTRQNLFFSATMPREIAALAADMLHDPVRVSVAPVATTVDRVTQQVYMVDGAAKKDILAELLKPAAVERAIVFTRTKRGADRVADHLEKVGVNAAAIHGNKSQNQRVRALDGFRKGQTRVLVATDIAARGIDVDAVTHVVNYELPDVPESYVHRIGRTARAGAEGIAISLCDNSERPLLRAIEKLTRQTLPVIDRRTAGGAPAVDRDARPDTRRDRGRPSGRGPGGHARPAAGDRRPGPSGPNAGRSRPAQRG